VISRPAAPHAYPVNPTKAKLDELLTLLGKLLERDSKMDLDALLTVAQFAAWQQVPERTVRKRLASMPGVIQESRECVRIHPRTYLEARLKKWKSA
jgi:hypothetical protein